MAKLLFFYNNLINKMQKQTVTTLINSIVLLVDSIYFTYFGCYKSIS